MDDQNPAAASSRGDTTREALLGAAIEIFGRDGFNAASTRAISEAAGVNQALIGYHFGGKPGLYLATLKFIADTVIERIGPLVDSIEAELAADAGDPAQAADRAIALLTRFTDAFVRMITSEESQAWARLILREQQDPSEGFEVLYQGIMHRMLGMTTRLVERAKPAGTTPERCKLTALTIVGQALIFRVGRAAVLREMGWAQITPAEIEAIQEELRRNVVSILKAENSQ